MTHRPNRYSDDFLLDAAAEVFHARGFHEVSMDDVAAHAGVTKPTYYARFGVKEKVFDAVLQRVADSLNAHFDTLYEEGPSDNVEDGIERLVRSFFAWVRANPVGFQLLFASDQIAPAGVDHRARALNTLAETLRAGVGRFLRERGLRPGRATGLIVASFVAVLRGASEWLIGHEDADRVDPEAFCTAFILHGLAGVDPRSLSARRRKRSAADVT